MRTKSLKTAEMELDDFVEAFEAAQACGRADLAGHLPEPAHPLYRAVLRELVRVDLEYTWSRGEPQGLADYLRRFPALADDLQGLQEIAFEECRLRQEAGENPSPPADEQPLGASKRDWPGSAFALEASPGDGDGPLTLGREARNLQPLDLAVGFDDTRGPGLEELALAYDEFHSAHTGDDFREVCERGPSFRFSAEHADFFQDVHRLDPQATQRVTKALTGMPKAGMEFQGFRLLAELGQGAFAKVFLAEQAGLANRRVALKISADIVGEPQTLAQLQHTNIVPIYSVHHAGPFQAICMPFFGATTLGEVIQSLGEGTSVPASGKMLVSTINTRRSATQPETGLSGRLKRPPCLPVTANQSEDDAPPSVPNADAVLNLKMLEELSYVEAVLWIGTRLADGLAHAHERGILHRDLKPANILLTDECQPMLLDFNLSQDTKLHSTAAGAVIGGTLPYMAPEHLQAFQGGTGSVDGRSDVYSLGVILYELLTGCRPFPDYDGRLARALPRLLEDRLRTPPRLRRDRTAISPAVESIVRHCLEPDPGKRYQTAQELRADLQRQLDFMPLRYAPEPSLRERAWKWKKRHPRLTSPISIALVASVFLLVGGAGLLLVRGQRLARLEARNCLTQFREDMRASQCLLNAATEDKEHIEKGIAECQRALGAYQVLENSAWQQRPLVQALPEPEQRRLREDVGEMLLLLARAKGMQGVAQETNGEDQGRNAFQLVELAESCYPDGEAPRALWVQRAELARQHGQESEAALLLAQAKATPFRTARDRYLTAGSFAARGEFRQALPALQEAVRQDPQDFGTWFLLGICHFGLGQDAKAVACYSTCIALWPSSYWAYFNRGVMYLHQRAYQEAGADFDEAIRLRPDLGEAYLNRSLAWQGLKHYAEAVADLTRALELSTCHTRAYFMRARAKELMGDQEGARQDIEQGLRLEPADEKDWIARGVARLSNDPQAALADFDMALRCNSRSRAALQNQAHVLAERLGRTEEAVAVLDKAVALYPDHVPARAGRGVLLARLKQRAAAHRDAEEALSRDASPPTLYQVAGIYALTSHQHPADRREALELLSSAFRKGYGLHLIEADKDWDYLRRDPDFRRLVELARAFDRDSRVMPQKTKGEDGDS